MSLSFFLLMWRFNTEIRRKKTLSIETVSNSNRKLLERGQIDTLNTQIHDRSLSWLRSHHRFINGRKSYELEFIEKCFSDKLHCRLLCQNMCWSDLNHHDTTEILLKVSLNTITSNTPSQRSRTFLLTTSVVQVVI